ncbi:hypothetical protein ACHAXA_002003 [Cyclostephanos tholiformis]|uniref:Protein ENHANCED DISEASE RESISTANCE 2 C-terminal domain-containing protein n=1 Tax=Cyclostephanos tholiformis TaxID=382380 RepID=A0ABD3RZJ0_9STRA
MGSMFRRSGGGGGGGGGGGDQRTDGNDDDGDGEEKKDPGDDNLPPSSPPPPPDRTTPSRSSTASTPYFDAERLRFASESTLSLHSGSESTAPKYTPSWTPVDGTEFKVRCGPNYSKFGRKENSETSLYEVYCVRYFRSDRRTGSAAGIMPLPSSSGDDVGGVGYAPAVGTGGDHRPELDGTDAPDVLVVHFALPYESPNVFRQCDDGPGGECVYYLRPSRRFLDEMSGKSSDSTSSTPSPAARLFADWCSRCVVDPRMRGRFKCMALVRDIEKHNFGLLKTYNGKPVLITDSGTVVSGRHGDVRYLELTVNVHSWAFMAKKGFVSLMPKFPSMQMEVGFTIEAHTDEEMPECMLGSTVLSYISDTTGPMITPEMQEPVHGHRP